MYSCQAFTRNGRNTIETLDSNFQNTIGNRFGLSFYDIKYMNDAYCSGAAVLIRQLDIFDKQRHYVALSIIDVCRSGLSCENEGYPDPKNCNECRCPDGLGGKHCDTAEASE